MYRKLTFGQIQLINYEEHVNGIALADDHEECYLYIGHLKSVFQTYCKILLGNLDNLASQNPPCTSIPTNYFEEDNQSKQLFV